MGNYILVSNLLLTFVFKHFETAVKNENKVRLEIMIIFRALEIELEVHFRKTIPVLVVEIPMQCSRGLWPTATPSARLD